MATSPTTVDFLRHGQVATPKLFCAPSQEPLAVSGWEQLTLATQNGRWDAVITSPSRRCHAFAQPLAARLGCPLVVEGRFREMDFGQWVGMRQEEVWAQAPELLQQLWYQPDSFVAPGGEAMGDFIARIHAAWHELQAVYAGQQVLVLTHAGVIRAMLALVLGIPPQNSLRVEIGYAQITRMRVYPDGVVSLVGHGHLSLLNIFI